MQLQTEADARANVEAQLSLTKSAAEDQAEHMRAQVEQVTLMAQLQEQLEDSDAQQVVFIEQVQAEASARSDLDAQISLMRAAAEEQLQELR